MLTVVKPNVQLLLMMIIAFVVISILNNSDHFGMAGEDTPAQSYSGQKITRVFPLEQIRDVVVYRENKA